MDLISIRRIGAVISIFSLINMSLGSFPVFAENVQSTPETIGTISSLLEKEVFELPQADVLEKNGECRIEIPRKQIVPCVKKDRIITKELTVTATAYSSTVGQTDDDPCTTANGFNVCKANQENIIAANFLPFGTKVQFPEVYGDKIFTVQDRMHPRFSKRVDFWMKTTGKARQFGVKRVKVQVVEELLAQRF